MLPQMIEAARWVIEGGWSMSDAAKRHGVSYSGLRKIANGIRRGERKAPWEEGKWKK
jgi:transposase-like protein